MTLITYDDLGNLTNKSDTGIYTYAAYRSNGASRPHAVSNIAGSLNASYSYDPNGNVLSDGVRNYTYTSFNLPSQITKGSATTTLLYGPNHERAKETEANGTVSYNFNPRLDSGLHADYRIKANGDKEYVNYIYAGNRPVGTDDPSNALKSALTDHGYTGHEHLDDMGLIHMNGRRKKISEDNP